MRTLVWEAWGVPEPQSADDPQSAELSLTTKTWFFFVSKVTGGEEAPGPFRA